MERTKAKPPWTVFYESLIVEVTNPKTALFFLISLPKSGSVSTQLLILGIIATIAGSILLGMDTYIVADEVRS